jgi:hypothetical protein
MSSKIENLRVSVTSFMDEAARAAAYEFADQRFPLIYKLECPTCQTRNVGDGCLCMGNERTCENGHRMVRCQKEHTGHLVAIPPSNGGGHCFESWLGDKYWETDKRCACELAPIVWRAYEARRVAFAPIAAVSSKASAVSSKASRVIQDEYMNILTVIGVLAWTAALVQIYYLYNT